MLNFDYFSAILNEIDSIAAVATVAVMVLTAASLLIANLARYIQAKKFDVPLKMVHQAGIPDSLDIWIVFVSAYGFGLWLPYFMFYIDTYVFVVFVVSFASCYIGLFSTKATLLFRRRRKKKTPKKHSALLFYAVISLLTAAAYAYLHYVLGYYEDGYLMVDGLAQAVLALLANFLQILYVLVMHFLLILSIYRRLFGGDEVVTVGIGGQLYLVAVRHSANQWVLTPCAVEEDAMKGKKPLGNVVRFVKGQFIIRDLSTLADTIVHRPDYKTIGEEANVKKEL